MTEFTIADADLDGIKDKVVIVTGASSGIGLATVQRLVQHGANVFASDLNPLPSPLDSQVAFQKVDVTSWPDQVSMFKSAKEKYGKIDHVFANAGITSTFNLLEDDVDENGDLLPPELKTIDVNLIGCIYTTKLGIHYLKQNPEGGSIVLTASASSFIRFPPVDYTTAKHGVFGLLRSLYCNLYPALPIRINAIAPSWTATGIVPPQLWAALGDAVQSPDIVARSVTILMADQKRHGEMVYSEKGKYWEIENGELGLHERTADILGRQVLEEIGLKAIRERQKEKERAGKEEAKD